MKSNGRIIKSGTPRRTLSLMAVYIFLLSRCLFSLSFLMKRPSLKISLRSRGGGGGRRRLCSIRSMSTVKNCLSSDAIVGKNVAIVGGGLAGISTTYHLLQKSPSLNITIFDKAAEAGLGGASSVAGGLVHPLSPRGKLVHLGLEGLASTNALVDAAVSFEQGAVLRNEIWRIAISDEHVSTLKKTAADFPSFTEWFASEELNHTSNKAREVIKGALRLHGGCKVIHVPTYLAGLWKACLSLGSGTKQWRAIEIDIDDESWTRRLSYFDTVVFSAGAGLFQNSSNTTLTNDLDKRLVHLVLGQSCELRYPDDSMTPRNFKTMLCGKYISPLPDDRRLLVGATHEFRAPLSSEQVEIELKERTLTFAPEIWASGTVDKVTSGIRVQSARTGLGRLPILGSIESSLHPNAWIFTGLSSRGLLYHGFYGEILSDMILGRDIQDYPEVFWWKKGRNSGTTF